MSALVVCYHKTGLRCTMYQKVVRKLPTRFQRVRNHRISPSGHLLRKRTPARSPPESRLDPSHTSQPTRQQLKAHLMQTAVPMVGFGFMDQTILLQAGNAIDCTFGVWLGLSTLSAAAVGSIISNMGSVVFGGVVERTAATLGLASANFSHAQKRLPIVARTGMYGNLGGIFVGCVLGLVNLLFIDTEKARELKDEYSYRSEMYQIDATNDKRRDATIITIKGPDRAGLLAAIANAFADAGVSLLEVDAHQSENSESVEDVFVVQNKEKKQISKARLAKLVDRISGGLTT